MIRRNDSNSCLVRRKIKNNGGNSKASWKVFLATSAILKFLQLPKRVKKKFVLLKINKDVVKKELFLPERVMI